MAFSLAEFHHRNRNRIIKEWVRRLKSEVGDQYAQRPLEELQQTVSEAFDGDYHVMVNDDFTFINRFIEKITRMRLEAGFLLSDVQKAFELYRKIVIPLLAKETSIGEFQNSIDKINRCLAYTIHRFSDFFQNMHEKEILEHNRRLEEEVRERTAELRESELKYKTLVEEINDGYFVVQDEVVVFANMAFCQMHGYQKGEILGKNFYDLVASVSRNEIIEKYKKSMKRESTPRVFEYMRLTKEGLQFPTEITAKVTQYENRPCNIGICRDLTERVKMEKRVREAERMAYIGQITTSLSHEIRNPLSSVTMNLQILKKNPEIRGNDQRRIDIAVKEVKRLEHILKDLLDYAKPLQLKYGFSKINTILASCIELLEMKLDEKNLFIISSFDPELPDVRADREKLEQCFINLLLNAMESSHVKGKILVKSMYRPNGSQPIAEVTIADEGYGVPVRYLETIFKPFVTTKTKGTGLGLAMVKQIIEAHGGWIHVENRRPHGASFRVSFPV